MWSHEAVYLRVCREMCVLDKCPLKRPRRMTDPGASLVPKLWPWNVISHQRFSFHTRFIILIINGYILSSAFPASIYKIICIIFILCFVNMVDYLDQFAYVALSCAPGMNPTRSWCIVSWCIVIVNLLVFCLGFLHSYWSVVLFLCCPHQVLVSGLCWPHKMC